MWRFILALAILLNVFVSKAAESSSPPKHAFDADLAAMSTNAPGIYPLRKVWTGREQVTYSDAAPDGHPERRSYRFDAAQVSSGVRFRMFDYQWMIGEFSTNGPMLLNGHAYRSRLPTDAEIVALRNDVTLTNVLPHLRIFPWGSEAAGVGSESRHFTLGTNNTLETLSVYFYKQKPGTNYDSLTIRRGLMRREGVWWYP